MLLALVFGAPADRIELANGDVLNGTIVTMDDQTVMIRTEYGSLEIPRGRIVRGEFGDQTALAGAADGSADGSAASEDEEVLSGLVFRFPLDGSLDDAEGEFTLTNNGMEPTDDASGTSGGALRSAGTGTYLSLASTPLLDGLHAFTLFFRIRLESTDGTSYLASKWDRADGDSAEGKFTIQTTAGGLTLFLVGPDGRYHSVGARGVLRPNAWHAVAVSFSDGRAAIHVDSVEVRSRTFSFTELFPDDSPLLLMTAEARTENRYAYYNATGSIDEIRLYRRALSPQEVATLTSSLGDRVPD
jgi:hypothetical protein